MHLFSLLRNTTLEEQFWQKILKLATSQCMKITSKYLNQISRNSGAKKSEIHHINSLKGKAGNVSNNKAYNN